MSKSKLCPYRRHCHSAGDCENCDFGKAFENLNKKIKKLKEKNESLQNENEALKERIAGYRKQEWISVEERLPTWEDGKVLVFTTYGFSVCERTVNGRWQGKHANWITHWMPLPEPPKGE